MRAFDYSQLQSRQWDSEILGLVAQIHEFKGRQELYLKKKPAVLDKLIDIAKVQSTEASNKIEGIVTTNTRVQQLCMEKTTPRNRDEIMGYRDVLNTIHESYEYIPIRASYILQLHRDLYKYSERGISRRSKAPRTMSPPPIPMAEKKYFLHLWLLTKPRMPLIPSAIVSIELWMPVLLIHWC